MPTQGAEPPPPVESKPPPELPPSDSPADLAAKAAIKERLAEDKLALKARLEETERAEQWHRERAEQQRQLAQQQQPEPQQQPEMPAAVAKWLAEHPQYADPRDVISQAEINLATMKCIRDGLLWTDENFVPTLEQHLGLRREQPPASAKASADMQPRPQPQPQPRHEQAPPARQQQRMSVPVSAPPTRDAPSMATGRPMARRAPLTSKQIEHAYAAGVSLEEYEKQLRKMEAMKASGEIQDGR